MSTPTERYRPTVRALAERVRAEHGGLAAHLVMRAYDNAAARLDGTFRLNGDPFLAHCVAVAQIAADVSTDPTVIASALLHDVGDHVPEGRRALRMTFGHEIADLIEAADDIDRETRDLRAFDVVDERVLVLKLSDRLHNLHTIGALQREKQLRKARHTLDVVVPLAERSGIPLGARLREAATYTIASPAGVTTRQRRGVSGGVLTAAARLLPTGQRERWASEWRGELASLPNAVARLRFAADVALGAPSLAVVTRRSRT